MTPLQSSVKWHKIGLQKRLKSHSTPAKGPAFDQLIKCPVPLRGNSTNEVFKTASPKEIRAEYTVEHLKRDKMASGYDFVVDIDGSCW